MVYEIHEYVCDHCGMTWPSYGQAEQHEDGHKDGES